MFAMHSDGETGIHPVAFLLHGDSVLVIFIHINSSRRGSGAKMASNSRSIKLSRSRSNLTLTIPMPCEHQIYLPQRQMQNP